MRSSLRYSFLPVAILSVLCHANPIPQASGLTAQQICSMSDQNPAQTWKESGAAAFLEDFIKKNGPSNWANKIDQSTTAGGSLPDSNLDCADLRTGNCRAPTLQCTLFTPPQLHHIRNAMSTNHRMLLAYQEELQDAVIDQILGTSQLVSDFGQPEPGFNLFGLLNGAFTIAAGLGAGSPFIGGPLTVISGIFGVAGAINDPTIDIKGDIDARLKRAFKDSRDRISLLARTIYGAESNTALLAEISPPAVDGETTDVARYFSGGRFFISANVNLDKEVKDQVEKGVGQLRRALVIRALKVQEYLVFVDTGITSSDSCNAPGARFTENKCYKLVKFSGGPLVKDIQNISGDMAGKFGNYGIDGGALDAIYKNAEECQKAKPNGDGEAEFQGVKFPAENKIPQCYFNLRVQTGRECVVCGPSSCTKVILPQCPK